MDITAMIAANTRRIREQKKLTLEAAASLTGVSRSMLAQIEKGEVNPTISVLWKIANGYKVSFTSLAENRGAPVRVVRGSELQPLLEDAGRYQNYPIFPFDEGKLFETYRIVIQPGGEPGRPAPSFGSGGIYYGICRPGGDPGGGSGVSAFQGGRHPLLRGRLPRLSEFGAGSGGTEHVDLL